MTHVPWWYSVVREWRYRAFLETGQWPRDIAVTISANVTSEVGEARPTLAHV